MKKKFMLRVIACLMMAVMISTCMGTVGTAMADQAAHKGELTVAGNDGYWGQHDTTMTEVLGDVALEDVTYIRFYSNAGFILGYNNGVSEWYQTDKVTEYVMKDLNKDPYKWTLAIIANEFTGTEVTVKWEVYTTGTPEDAITTKTPVDKGETVALETIVNQYWGVYSNLIPNSTLEKYKDGVVLDVAIEVDGDYGLLTPINDTTDWPKLIKETTGVEFNSDDGQFIVFGADTKSLKMTLTAEGVEKALSTGSGIRFQGNQVKFKEVTLTAVPPKATPTPLPTATPTPTPVPITEDTYTTTGDVLLVTEDMVTNGKIVIENAKYNSVLIPRDLAEKVVLRFVKADEIIVEGGADYTVTLYRCDIEKVDVAAAELDCMTFEELQAALEVEGADRNALIHRYVEETEAKTAAAETPVNLTATYFTTVKEINVKTSAKIDANGCEVDSINLAVADTEGYLEAEVKNFNGAMSVDLDCEDATNASLFTLKVKDSNITNMEISGDSSTCFIEGKNAAADAISISGTTKLTLNMAADSLVVDETTSDAKVRIYSKVEKAVVKGEANSIVLPSSGKITNLAVEGNDIMVYGYGRLGTADITGTGANVAVIGAVINGDNDLSIPKEMADMDPDKHFRPTSLSVDSKPQIPVGVPAYTGSMAFLDEADYYADKAVSMSALLGDVSVTDVEYIVIYADVNTGVGFNSKAGGWKQQHGGRWYLVPASEIDFSDGFAMNLVLNNGTGVDQTVFWEVYTTPMAETLADTRSVTIEGVANDSWNAGGTSVSVEDILGDVNPDDVAYILFKSTVNFGMSYNGSNGKIEVPGTLQWKADDLNFDNLGFYTYLNICDAGPKTLTWEIYTLDGAGGSGGSGDVEDDNGSGTPEGGDQGDNNGPTGGTGGGGEPEEDVYSVTSDYSAVDLVRPFYFTKIDGDVTVTVEFERGASGYPQLNPQSNWGTGLIDYLVGLEVSTEGFPYYLNEWGCLYVTDDSLNEISFVISAEGAAILMAQDGLKFNEEGNNLHVTSVTLSGTQASGYMGDGAELCKILPRELSEGTTADVVIDYSLTDTWGQIYLFVIDNGYNYIPITEDDFAELTYDINEYHQITTPGHLTQLTFTLKEDVVAAAKAGNGIAIKNNMNVILNGVSVE